VSGGSILAAHLAQRWDEYKEIRTFNDAAEDLRKFGDRDVRGRIVRTWLLAGTWFGLPLFLPSLRREQMLIGEYKRFLSQGGRSTQLSVLSPKRLSPNGESFPHGPRVHLLTTSLTTGLLCEFTGDGLLRLDDRKPGTQFGSPRFNLPVAVAASSAFPPLFPPITIDADVFGIGREDFGVDVDRLSDGGVYDNLGISAAMRGFWKRGEYWGTDILVGDASASFRWNTRSNFWNILGRTSRSSDVLMKRVAELEVEGERIAISAAGIQVSKRRFELEQKLQRMPAGTSENLRAERERLRADCEAELRRLSEYPLPTLRVVRIDGARDDDLVGHGFQGPHYNAFEGQWNPIRWDDAPVPSRSPWAKVMASMRTDLDRFSSDERHFLEIWGYEQARDTWSLPTGLPGCRHEKIGEPPNEVQLINLQKSAYRKSRLIELRDPIGIALSITWCLLLLMGIFFVGQLAPRVLLRFLGWLSR
jgi:predicted acylesterase/phospholipase RssA